MLNRTIKPGERIVKRLDPAFLEIKSIDEKTRTIWHPVTREVTDRMGDIVRIDGGDLEEFKKKPAVLYGHQYGGGGFFGGTSGLVPIIAENVGFEKDGDRFMAGTKFLDVAIPGMSQALKDLVNDNWILQSLKLMGWSIGFIPIEWSEVRDGEEVKGYDFKRWKLLEYSSVVIPAHQDAINDALKGGLISGAVAKYFDMGASGGATAIAAIEDDPNKREAAPEVIKEPAKAPEAKATETKQGETMLEKIIEKLSKGEDLTPEEKEFWTKYQNAMAPKPAVAPVRKLDLNDGPVGVQVRSMTDIMNEPHGARTMSGPLNDCEHELQEFSENAYITATLLGKNPRQLKMWDNYLGRSSALRKALDTATATEGAEWVPTLLSADFITKFRLAAKVAALFPDFAMPSNPWKMPYFGGLSASNFYYVGESISDEATASPPTTPATGDQTLTAKKLKSRIYFSDELVEDSIVPVIETLRADLAVAGTEVLEDLIINGDTTTTHQDSDVVDSKDRRKAWSGLRKLCPSATKGSLATFTAMSHIQAFVTLMGKYGINPAELAFITGGVGYSKFRALTEVITVDKYGPQAVVLTGELGKLLGIPILVSEYIRENLNATGVYDATTMTKTQVLIVNRRGFMLGTRGGVKLTFKAEAEVDQNQLIMSFRKAFQPRWTPSATVLTIANGYNVA
jgi:HK97 family phage major capsid protein